MTQLARVFTLASIGILSIFSSSCSKSGCTDPLALNYDGSARNDDGTCIFPNVLSRVVSVLPNEWQGDGFMYTAIKLAPQLTPGVTGDGVILVYLVEPDGLQIQLPVSIPQFEGYTSNYWFNFYPGDIEFVIQDDDGLTPPPADRIDFRVVVIDQYILKSAPEVDYSNYEEVARVFGLEEAL
jgi:hypothetical protein